MWRVLRDRGGDESGAVLVIMAVLTVSVFLPLAALAIDIPSYDQAQRQAQAAADAGALAASQDLGSTTSSSATSDGTAYALKNFPGATVSVGVNTVSQQATVSVTATTPNFFGRFVPSTPATPKTVTASAVASETPGTSSACTTAGNSCYAIYAADASCSGTGIKFNGGGNTLNGAVWSAGALSLGGGGSTFNGTVSYGTSCIAPTGYNTFNSGQPAANAPATGWPIDYSKDFPPCGAVSDPCNVQGTPSFCTSTSLSTSETLYSYWPNTDVSNNIYCDIGTGTPSDPTTWTGAITVNATSQIESTYVAGSVTLSSGSQVEACGGYAPSAYSALGCSASVPVPSTGNYPVIYAVGSGNSVTDTSGGTKLYGDVFAPNGTIDLNGGGQGTNFLEALDVIDGSGGVIATGDGPSSSVTGSSSGSESLLH